MAPRTISISCIAKGRRKRGALLIIVIALIFVIILLMVFAFNIWKLMTQRQDSQAITNSIALQSAGILNDNDCIGRMNNMVGLSRELVFNSRLIHNFTLDPDHSMFEPLARQLLDQSRHGAWLLEIGRQQITAERLQALRKMLESNTDLESSGGRVVDLEVGYLNDVWSNAYDDTSDELQDYDRSKGWIDSKTRRFKGNINAKLPDEDAEQIFKLSPLRTLFKGNVQEAGLINANNFVRTAKLIDNEELVRKAFCDQMPDAAKIKIAFPGNFNLSLKNKVLDNQDVQVQAAAVSSGGQPMP